MTFSQIGGTYGFTTFVSDPIDITHKTALTFGITSISNMNHLYVGVTDDFKAGFTFDAYEDIRSVTGAHSISVSSLSGNHYVVIVLATENNSTKSVSFDSIAFT